MNSWPFMRTPRRPSRKNRLFVEQLETRVVLSVWTGGDAAAPTNWSDPNNWLDHTVPSNGAVVRFDTTAGAIGSYAINNDIPNLVLGGITINDANPTSAFAMTGLPVSLSGPITSSTSGPAPTIGLTSLTLAAAGSWTNNLGGLNITSNVDLAGFSLQNGGP
jgi:hypothetical protein